MLPAAADPPSSGAPPTLPPGPSGSAAGFSPPTMVPLQRAGIPGNLADIPGNLAASHAHAAANGLFVPAVPSVSGHADCDVMRLLQEPRIKCSQRFHECLVIKVAE